MSTSEKTFTQVKDILRKLERSIDQAREKRLHHDDEHETPSAASSSGQGSSATPASPRSVDEPARLQARPQAAVRNDPPRTSGSSGWMSR